MNDLLNRLGMEPISPLFDQCYEVIKEDDKVPDWLTEGFLQETLSEFPLLARARENYRELRYRGADEAFLQATAARMDDSITDSIRIAGMPVLSLHYFRWLTVNCHGKPHLPERWQIITAAETAFTKPAD